MDSTKLNKSKSEKLPSHVRFGNALMRGLDFFEFLEGILVIVLTLLFGVLSAPFVLFYQVIRYLFKGK